MSRKTFGKTNEATKMLDRRLMIAVLILYVSTSASFAADAPALDIQEPTQQDLAFRLPTVRQIICGPSVSAR